MSKNRRRNKEEEKADESWLLPYADMLTLLLALFIVLFAMSEVDVKKFQSLAYIFQTEFTGGAGVIDDGVSIIPEETPVDLIEDKDADEDFEAEIELNQDEEQGTDDELTALEQAEYEDLKEMQQTVEAYIAANNLSETLETHLLGEGLLISVRTDITFDSGSAKVKPNGVKIARDIAGILQKNTSYEVVVNGHADDRPVSNAEFASNWELSSMRAIQFMYLILDDVKINPALYSARGYGEYRPVVPNTSEKNRAKNRRVEVLIQSNFDIEEIDEKINKEAQNED